MVVIPLAVLVGAAVVSAEQVASLYHESYTTSSCPCPIYSEVLQPVYYTQHLTTSSVIRPFPDSDPLTISSWPTDVQLSSTLTRILTGCAQPITSTSIISATSTIILVTSSPSTTANPQSLYIGEGLPGSPQTSLSEFLFIVYQPTTTIGPVKRDLRPRQAASTSPVRAVNLAQATGSYESPGQNNCDDASPLLLQDGRLIQYDNSVAKQVRENVPLLGFILPPPANEVNATFSINNGFLDWTAQDLNIAATWLVCGSYLYADFAAQAPVGCTPVSVGVIAGSACIQRVESSRAANPQFVAPSPAQRTLTSATLSSLISTAGQSNPTIVPTSTSSSIITSLSTSTQGSVVSSFATSATTGASGSSSPTLSRPSQNSQSPSTFTGYMMSTLSTAAQAFLSSSTEASSSTTPSLSSEATTSPSSLATTTSTTTSSTPSATACIAPGTNSFKIRANDPSGQVDGFYAQVSDNGDGRGAASIYSGDIPTIFSLNLAGNLLVKDAYTEFNGYFATEDQNANQPFHSVAFESTPVDPLLVCSYDTDCQLSCIARTDTVFEVCGGYLRLSSFATGDSGCTVITLSVVDPAAT